MVFLEHSCCTYLKQRCLSQFKKDLNRSFNKDQKVRTDSIALLKINKHSKLILKYTQNLLKNSLNSVINELCGLKSSEEVYQQSFIAEQCRMK